MAPRHQDGDTGTARLAFARLIRETRCMNATLEKFGYPGSVVWQGGHWAVLLRPQQVTLGALVLCVLADTRSYSGLSASAAAEHGHALQLVEKALQRFRTYDKLNFLTLMMVEPHLHSHVLPRYATPQSYGGQVFQDAGWPTLPDLKSMNETTDNVRANLLRDVVAAFKSAADA